VHHRLIGTVRRWAAAARPLEHGAINERIVHRRFTFLEPPFVPRVEIVPGRGAGRWEGRCIEARSIMSRRKESSLALVFVRHLCQRRAESVVLEEFGARRVHPSARDGL
jgi:hypothetical protein